MPCCPNCTLLYAHNYHQTRMGICELLLELVLEKITIRTHRSVKFFPGLFSIPKPLSSSNLFHHIFTAQACPAQAGLLEQQQMLDEDTQKNAGWGPQCKHHNNSQRTSTLAHTQQWWKETLEGPAFASWFLGLLANCWWVIAWYHTKENHLAQNGMKKKRDTVHMCTAQQGSCAWSQRESDFVSSKKRLKDAKFALWEDKTRGQKQH